VEKDKEVYRRLYCALYFYDDPAVHEALSQAEKRMNAEQER